MSQARVTDFFAQRKKGGVDGGVRRGKGKTSGAGGRGTKATTITADTTTTTRSLRSAKSAIHEEFIRVIDEATAVDHGSPGPAISPPRTPKRTSADAEFDLGAALFCSSAEKKVRVEVGSRDKDSDPAVKAPKRTARKKLILGTPQAPVSSSHVSKAPSPQPLSHPTTIQKETKNQVHHIDKSSPDGSTQVPVKQNGKQTSKALSKEELAALKSRLQKIKKQAEKLSKPPCPSNASPAAHSPSVSATTAPASDNGTTTTPVVDKTQMATVPDVSGLKATLSRAKELAASVQKRKEEREKQERETPTQESDDLPGYQRYHTLAEPVPPGLTLPYQYKLLADVFRSMDTIVGMLYNRSETATFAKVKQGVQDMTHRRFEESHLGRIKTVFPNAYTFRQEKNIPTFSYNIKKGSYQLTMEPILCPGESDQNEARPLLSASRLLERRRIFHQNLVSIVKHHHRAFLSSVVPPLSVPDDQLTRWHPRFNVDTVPLVECSVLPQPPHTDKLSTAQEVLDKARTLMTPKMEKALTNMALKTVDPPGAEQITPETSTPVSPTVTTTTGHTSAATTQTPSALKGVSQSLLERIRAKEAQKLQAAMTRNPVQEQRLLMMSRLPELARILRNVFVAEKKPALIMELACNRMVASYRSALSTGEMEKHLQLLSELASDWLKIHPIRKDLYLKLNKNMELNIVVDKLNARLKEEEKH